MDIGEFVDTYSDDLITIHEARAAGYTHPLKGRLRPCRVAAGRFVLPQLVVFVGGGIEAMLESWRGRDSFNVLEKYFAQNERNGERLTSLYQAFSDAGLHMDRQVPPDETPRRRQ
jgi:hypothetical protein